MQVRRFVLLNGESQLSRPALRPTASWFRRARKIAFSSVAAELAHRSLLIGEAQNIRHDVVGVVTLEDDVRHGVVT